MDPRISKFSAAAFLFLAIAFYIPIVQASLACGQVNSKAVEPQWMKVKVYGNDSMKFTTCTVSPAENKFCCDTEAIPGFGWAVGKVIKGEIFDNKYFTEPVSLYISGQGYDVFPQMQLKKAINLNNFSRVVFSKEPEFLLNISLKNPFNMSWIEKNQSREFLFEGEEYEGIIQGEWGMNYMIIISGDKKREFLENISVAILSSFEINRRIECDKCKNNLIKSTKEAVIILNLTLSHAVNGVELREYVSKSFEILETEGEVRDYSSTHNVIVWNISGKEVIKRYKVKSPKIIFFPRNYPFREELEGILLKEEKLTVSRFFSFWGVDEGIELKQARKNVYSRISLSNPLVFKLKDNQITRIGIFPKGMINNAEFTVNEYSDAGTLDELSGNVSYYSFDTNIASQDIEKIFLEFKVPKNNSGNFRLYLFEGKWEEWEESTAELIKEDKEFDYYQIYIPATKKVALVGEEEGSLGFLRIFN